MAIITIVLEDTIPQNNRTLASKLSHVNFKGQSFLVNPAKLLRFIRSHQSNNLQPEIVQYVYLASFRRYSDYLVTNQTTLNLLESPVGTEVILKNKLLSIKDSQIVFKLEKF